MRAVWSSILVPGSVVVSALLWGCGGGGSCDAGALGSSDICPPPTYGYARVTGTALRSDGSPIVAKEARVGCGDVVGGYSDATDAEGRFSMPMGYAVEDTTLYPFPPRAADGSFDVSCIVFLELSADITLVQDPVAVRFTPTREAVVPTVVELRQTSQ